MNDAPTTLILWEETEDGLRGLSVSRQIWQVRRPPSDRPDGMWQLLCGATAGSDQSAIPGAIAGAPRPEPLVRAAEMTEAMRLAADGKTDALDLATLIEARTFALAQREDMLAEAKRSGIGPIEMRHSECAGLREELMWIERAILALSEAAVGRGFKSPYRG